MPIAPHKGEDQSKWMSRCVPEMIGTGEDKRPQEQAVAACLDIWRQEHGGKKPPSKEMDELIERWKQILAKQDGEPPDPDPDESREEYLDRCVSELTDSGLDDEEAEERCQNAWEERSVARSKSLSGVVHKTHAEIVQGMEFVLSDESADRLGDIIVADGWDINSFQRNPVALFNHNPSFPIGRWEGLHVHKSALRGRLVMAPEGTSARIDEIRKLIDAGILKAVSVGFRDIESEPLDKKNPFRGRRYLKQELVETSLVAIPANPNALAISKSLGISPATLDLVFLAKHGKRGDERRSGLTGKHAQTARSNGGSAMSLAQRISDLETQIVDKRDALEAHLTKMDDSNVSDADLEKTGNFNNEIMQLEKTRNALVDSERLLAKTAISGSGNGDGTKSRALTMFTAQPAEPKAQPIIGKKKDLDPISYIVRASTVAHFAKQWNQSLEETRNKIYGDDESTKVCCDLVLRASSAPAITTVTGWAAELVQTDYADLMPLLMPAAIMTRLAAKGMTLSFGTAGRIVIPTRSRTPTIAGSFVGEGLAIPVRQGAFTSQTLVPKKLAVISTWTREMGDHSVPAIEGLIREAIQQDTTVAVDSVLLDANPATAIRPPGLLNGVTVTTATAGGGIAALIGDIRALVGALTVNTYGNLRSPVFLMNPSDMLAISLLQAPNTGIFPFRDEIRGGTLNTIPVIDSATVTAKTVILIDAADFVVVGGGPPRLETSDQATLHMEDTSPAELVASPATVAAPQRSLFQTDSIALRMILPLNWVQRRTGTIAWTQNATWAA
jgi:HK97 family phage major capsid protein/HK97 family phage prohead protease